MAYFLNFLKRLMFKAVHRLLGFRDFLFRPCTLGARIIVINQQNEVLLVKHSYGAAHWFLPGGGVDKGEAYAEAAARELNEELGIQIISEQLVLFGVYLNKFGYKTDYIGIFLLNAPDISLKGDRKEIENAQFFPLDNLPSDVSPGTRRRITELLSKKNPTHGIW